MTPHGSHEDAQSERHSQAGAIRHANLSPWWPHWPLWDKGFVRQLSFRRHRFPAGLIRHADDEGEVLDLVMQRNRDTEAALRRLKRLLRNRPVEPESITIDGLGSYVAILDKLGLQDRHRPGRLRGNNRAENTHLPIRSLMSGGLGRF